MDFFGEIMKDDFSWSIGGVLHGEHVPKDGEYL